MRRILISTTALSVALSSFHTLPAMAQTQTEDGSVIGPDGTVLCTAAPDAPCDLEAITRQLAEQAAQAEAAAAAEAEAAAQAEADAAAAAAAAAAQAEAEAAAAAEAEAAAQAEAQAQAEAEAAAAAAAQAQAEAEAAAAADAATAEAEAAAAAEAEAAAQAQAEADAAAAAQAEAEAAAAAAEAETQAQIEADAEAARAQEEAAAAAAAAEEAAAAAQAEAEAAVEAVEGASDETAAPAPEAESAVEGEAVVTEETTPEAAAEGEAVTTEAEAAPEGEAVTAEGETAVADEEIPEGTDPADALAEAPVAETAAEEPVDAPVPEAEAVEALSGLLGLPAATETPAEGGSDADSAALLGTVAAAAAAAAAAGEAPAEGTEAAPAAEPVAVLESLITPDSTRSSEEEFAAAPVAVSEGKKSGLSDLEKVGLVALGALAVGAIIKSNNAAAEERKVISNTGDRVVVQNPDGSYVVYKDDDAVLRQPGVRTKTESYRDGSSRTIVEREDGTQVVTVRDASGRVLKRSYYDRSGIETVLIDDLYPEQPIIVSELPRPRPDRVTISTSDSDAALRAEMAAMEADSIGRKFSLRQIREIPQVRALAATVEVDSITFDTGSSAIRAAEARKLADLGRLMQSLLDSNPRHVFLIEGHTDAVGSAASNLLLSDRRAESLAKALTEYFGIAPENLVVQGYGESELKVQSSGDERANRRVVVRLITPLLRTAEAP